MVCKSGWHSYVKLLLLLLLLLCQKPSRGTPAGERVSMHARPACGRQLAGWRCALLAGWRCALLAGWRCALLAAGSDGECALLRNLALYLLRILKVQIQQSTAGKGVGGRAGG